MKKRIKYIFVHIIGMMLLCINGQAQNPVNWTDKQLMEPADLAQAITGKKNLPHIICIGPGATIPGSVNVGMVNTTEGVNELKGYLKTLQKDQKIVVYCGCCPFEHCPNARPAITALKEMKFTNYYLLNLPHNLKTDWISKGYPTTKL